MAIKSYSELEVWQLAMQTTKQIYKLVTKLPQEEMFALSNQIRRAAVSIPSNIAEGFERGSNTEFIRFIRIAQGSRAELETQLHLCTLLEYLSTNDIEQPLQSLASIGRMLNSLIKALNNKTNK